MIITIDEQIKFLNILAVTLEGLAAFKEDSDDTEILSWIKGMLDGSVVSKQALYNIIDALDETVGELEKIKETSKMPQYQDYENENNT